MWWTLPSLSTVIRKLRKIVWVYENDKVKKHPDYPTNFSCSKLVFYTPVFLYFMSSKSDKLMEKLAKKYRFGFGQPTTDIGCYWLVILVLLSHCLYLSKWLKTSGDVERIIYTLGIFQIIQCHCHHCFATLPNKCRNEAIHIGQRYSKAYCIFNDDRKVWVCRPNIRFNYTNQIYTSGPQYNVVPISLSKLL